MRGLKQLSKDYFSISRFFQRRYSSHSLYFTMNTLSLEILTFLRWILSTKISTLFTGSRWKVRDLTYRVSKYPKRLGRSEVDAEVERAFTIWSDVSPLTFTKKNTGAVRINISNGQASSKAKKILRKLLRTSISSNDDEKMKTLKARYTYRLRVEKLFILHASFMFKAET